MANNSIAHAMQTIANVRQKYIISFLLLLLFIYFFYFNKYFQEIRTLNDRVIAAENRAVSAENRAADLADQVNTLQQDRAIFREVK